MPDFPTKWPEEAEIPGFRVVVVEFVGACHHVGLKIVRAMDLGLGLPGDTPS